MPTLVPVDGNPFNAPAGPRLTPVEGNPFAPLAHTATFQKPEDETLYDRELAKARATWNIPRAPQAGADPNAGPAGTPEDAARDAVIRQRTIEGQQAEFDATRTPLKRATDTAAFIASMPVRMATRGEYGIGDIMPGQPGINSKASEAAFAQANQPGLELAAQAGEIGMGIPGLQSIGAVPEGLLAANRLAIANRMARGTPKSAAAPLATEAQAYGPAMRVADRTAFVEEGIPEFAPAFGSKGLARVARTTEEMPLVGGTVKVPKTAVEQAMAARQAEIAQGAGAATSAEDVGTIAQRGLSRFRGSELQDLERSQVQELGLTADRPAQAAKGNVNINRPSQLNTAAMTAKELEQAAASKINLPGSTRSHVEDLTPAEIDKIIALPARDTSFATKASALYKRAEDARPALMRTNETASSNLLATRNSASVARGLMQHEASASIKGGVLEGRFGNLVQDLANGHRNFTLDSLRAARTEVGRALSNFGQFDARLDRSQMKQLYGAISNDYQAGLVALAARARKLSKLSPGDKGYVVGATSAMADAADRALQHYRVADRYYRNGIERMDRFMGVLGAETLEQASRKIGAYLKENTQNIRALESISSSLRPEEWRAVLGNVVEGLGRLTPGSREAEKVFSFERYATDWNKISQNPRTLELFRRSLGAGVVASLNNMGRIAERMKYYETTKNYSGSAYTLGAGAGLATIWNPSMWPALIGGVAAAGVTGKVLTSKWFAAWVNSLNRAQLKVGSSVKATKQELGVHLRRLAELAAREPDPEVSAAMRALGLELDQQLQATSPQ